MEAQIIKPLFVKGIMKEVGDIAEFTQSEFNEFKRKGLIEDVEEVEDLMKPLEEMTKAELFQYAKDVSIDVPKKATVAQLLKLLTEED